MSNPQRIIDGNAFTEQKASWLELFFDLAYVAAIAQLTYWLIQSSGTLVEYFQFTILFLMVFASWLFMAFYKNAAGSKEDTFERVATLTQMFFVLVMSIFLQHAFDVGASGFVLGYVGTRFISVLLFSRFYQMNPDQAPKSHHLINGYRIAVILWLVTIFIPQPFQTLSWVLLIVFELLVPHTTSRKVENTVRIANRFHLPERLGLFTILVMGESVIVVAVVNNLADTVFTWTMGGIAAATFLILVGLWWMYFDHVEYFASGKKFSLFPYIYSHIPILLGVMFIAAATKIGMLGKETTFDPFWIATVGVSLTVFGFNTLKASTGQSDSRLFIPSIVFLFFLALGAVIIKHSFLVAITILTVVFYSYVYFEHKINHTELHALKHAE